MTELARRQTNISPSTGRDDFEYYKDMARELCRRAQHKAHVSDDEVLVLAVVASQLALANYLEPGRHNEQEALSEIIAVLDNKKVIHALRSKMADLLAGRIPRPRLNAPSGEEIAGLTSCNDPEEPAGG
jgi:hypothetical protein